MNDGVRQSDALPITFGKLTDDACAHIGETALLENRINPFARTATAQSLQSRTELEVFAHPHLVVQWIIFRHVTDAPTRFLGIVKDIIAGHARRARRGWHEAREDAHGGAFARAVRTEQSDDLATRHRKRNARQRRVTSVAFRQVADFNHRNRTHLATQSLGENANRLRTKTPGRELSTGPPTRLGRSEFPPSRSRNDSKM